MRAAQYFRMSTEHQQYSIPNQIAAIAQYASLNGLQVVRTYSDEARSGIDLRHRPGLRALLDDVISCRVDFQVVLVYDVSRWGRFQDTDESAHWEFLCKSAGVRIEYCAEPFTNDNSIATALLKTLKRTMAGEYLRELSAKTLAGQCELARRGYKLGGAAGFGLRRLLLDADGKPKIVLNRGDQKCLATERVTYTAGPVREVRVVRMIYRLFLKSGLSPTGIADYLNTKEIHRENARPWNRTVVQRILSHPKYTGCVVFNRKTTKLRSKSTPNPRDQWIVTPGCFEPLIPRQQFLEAQERLGSRVFLRTDEQLLLELQAFVKMHGRVSQMMLAADRNMAKSMTYATRFGSLSRALDRVTPEPVQGLSAIEFRARLKRTLQDEFAAFLAAKGCPGKRKQSVFTIPGRTAVLLEVARCFRIASGQLRWEVRCPVAGRPENLACIGLRLAEDNRSRLDFFFLPSLPPAAQRLQVSDDRVRRIAEVRMCFADIFEFTLTSKRNDLSSCQSEMMNESG